MRPRFQPVYFWRKKTKQIKNKKNIKKKYNPKPQPKYKHKPNSETHIKP